MESNLFTRAVFVQQVLMAYFKSEKEWQVKHN
jgi:hypothetical protein